MIEAYERAVLEWFNAIIPSLRDMVYGKVQDVLLAKKSHLVYPCMIYSRQEADWVLSKGYPIRDTIGGKTVESVFFEVPQVYDATIFLNNEKDLYKVANVIRQRWYRESYVYLRYPDKASHLKVAMRLYKLGISTERTGIDTKGPERVINVQWRSDLFLEAQSEIKRFTGYRISLNSNESRLISTCKADVCALE